jgi:hypothetical protein
MNTDTLHQLGLAASHAISWGLPQLILAVLIVMAARRHGLIGLWLLASAAILSLCVRVAGTAIMVFGVPKPAGWTSLYADTSVLSSILIFLLTILGWAALAFAGIKKQRPQ